MKSFLLRRIAELASRKCYLLDGIRDKTSMLFHLNRTALLLGLLFCSPHHANAVGEDKSGSEIFLKYCAGCHGFDGFAEYPHAPSFAMGERLHKSDDQLLRSVLAGRHGMPYWEHKLSIDMFRRAIAYLRTMEQRFRSGLPPREQPIPDMHYKFNPVGEHEDYWENWH